MKNTFKFELIKVPQEEINKVKLQFNTDIVKPWDPINQIDLEGMKNNISSLIAKFTVLEKNPSKPKKQRIISFIIPLILSPFLLYIHFVLIIFAFFPFLYILGYYKNLSKDIIKIQIAKENNYFYDSEPNSYRWNSLANKFSELFNKGNNSQYVEDEFFGEVEKDNQKYNFYSGLFTYYIESGSGKNRSNTRYDKHFFAIKLNKELKTKFHLYPESVFSKIGNFFTKKEINTESIEFNKAFAFSYNGSKNEQALEIVKTLSPAVQTKILDLYKKNKHIEILFSNNCVFFMFNGFFFKNMKTNLFSSVKIAQKDKDYLNNTLSNLISITSEMLNYIN